MWQSDSYTNSYANSHTNTDAYPNTNSDAYSNWRWIYLEGA
jgi:hypothetical protein